MEGFLLGAQVEEKWNESPDWALRQVGVQLTMYPQPLRKGRKVWGSRCDEPFDIHTHTPRLGGPVPIFVPKETRAQEGVHRGPTFFCVGV